MNILVTGASGFIGSALVPQLLANGHSVTCMARHSPEPGAVGFIENASYITGDISSKSLPEQSLDNIDIVIHLAARAHIMDDNSNDPLAAFRSTNTTGTENLATQAANQGVRRFIYISSIKVNGERTCNRPFTATDPADPQDPYAISKYEAEQILLDISSKTGMEVVIIRPPLVYGPGVKANFFHLVKLVDTGLPLPFRSVKNSRSMIALGNLINFIELCISHPSARNQTFLVSDGEDWSTPQLVKAIASALGKKSILIPLPPVVMKFLAHLVGKAGMIDRLVDSLQIDISNTQFILQWKPEQSPYEAIQQVVSWYKNESRNNF